jgi:hypothetical protein
MVYYEWITYVRIYSTESWELWYTMNRWPTYVSILLNYESYYILWMDDLRTYLIYWIMRAMVYYERMTSVRISSTESWELWYTMNGWPTYVSFLLNHESYGILWMDDLRTYLFYWIMRAMVYYEWMTYVRIYSTESWELWYTMNRWPTYVRCYSTESWELWYTMNRWPTYVSHLLNHESYGILWLDDLRTYLFYWIMRAMVYYDWMTYVRIYSTESWELWYTMYRWFTYVSILLNHESYGILWIDDLRTYLFYRIMRAMVYYE